MTRPTPPGSDPDSRKLVEMDERGRISLARLGRREHRHYLAHVEPNGTIVLTPATVVPATTPTTPARKQR